MKDIEIGYVVGNEIKKLKVTFTSNGIGQVMIDNWYQGQAVFAQNKWTVYLNTKSELNNKEDIDIVINLLNSH